MFFRGTLDELENHFLLIYLKTSKKNVTKLISLRGISQTLYLKTTIKLFDNKDSKDFEDSSKKKNSEEQKPILDGNPDDENNILDEANDFFHGDERNSLKNIDPNKEDEEEEDDELLQDDKNTIYITVEGRVSLNNIPRFKQKGELIRFKKNERYLIVLVNRVESVMAPDDRNRIDSFVSVNWGGNEKFTQTFYDSNQPDFNEVLILF